MSSIDGIVVFLYIIGTLAIGLYAARRNKTAQDMFTAGGRSPWWVSGLSSFMTLKSAGTFVVWGGLAYREGVVAIAINTTVGLSGLLVGSVLASRWRRLDVATPAEFVAIRFGQGAVRFYTWAMLAIRVFSTGIALYAVAVMFAALVPLAPGVWFRDALTGNLSVSATIVLFGAIILFYTIAGGLWAVLMTDVLQFIVLQVAVLFVVLLLAFKLAVGGALVEVPEGYFNAVSPTYGYLFLVGWAAVHFFFVGAEWAFVQRYLCVPTARDAQKTAWLFGALYLISPTIWLATPILYRLMVADAPPEQAYILASKSVLPVGMLGLMMAAMFSATASAVSAQINVFAGVLSDQFGRIISPNGNERRMLLIGRGLTLIIGIALVFVALTIPALGGAEQIVLSISGLLLGPLMAPTVWGLLSSRVGLRSLYASALISFAVGFIIKFGMAVGAPLDGSSIALWVQENPRLADVLVGALLPNILLAVGHFSSSRPHHGWQETERRIAAYRPDMRILADHGANAVVAISLGATGLLMFTLLFFADTGKIPLATFGTVLLLLAVAAHRFSGRHPAVA